MTIKKKTSFKDILKPPRVAQKCLRINFKKYDLFS